ncbi:MAG TPA: SDR family oxidoreductase [Anaeromyxobacteraceae bacterium]|nr:SDR family oxidoreductase [Anaeromyxobacteraceae bacterium]
MHILVTGATGYVGGQLVPRLVGAGHRVRVLARDPERLSGRSWADRVEAVRGDVLDPATLPQALTGVDAAYYLVHSMAGSSFEERDVVAAGNFGAAAKAAGVSRVIYLGGLGDDSDARLSRHLASRQSTGQRLREAGPPVTEFRAAVIVGAGSLSFELVRYLTERLPVMICPRWVVTRIQPIAIEDVIEYLARALDVPASADRIVEIGGADVLTYRDMILGYARARGLRRRLVSVPVLTPRLSSYWVHGVTPIPAQIARPLIEGLGAEVIVRDELARRLFPDVQPLPYAEALRKALANVDRGELQSTWSDALASSAGDVPPVQLTTQEGMILERRQLEVPAPAAAVFRSFTGLGGRRGWLYGTWLWWLRGLLDRAVGGVGLRRGRRDPDALRVGDALDFWRVEEVRPDALLRLRAEMRVPGRAWLEFRVSSADGTRSTLVQTAYFAPRGLAGHVYWYLLYPIHAVIFSRLASRVADRARSIAAGER